MWWLLYLHIAGVVVTLFTLVATDSYNGSQASDNEMGTSIVMSLTVWPLVAILFSAEAFGKKLKERKERKVLAAKEEKARLHEVDRLLLDR